MHSLAKLFFSSALITTLNVAVFADDVAPKPWLSPFVEQAIEANVLYLPIAHPSVKAIPIKDSKEALIDLLAVNNPRIKPMAYFDAKYKATYEGYSKVRLGVYKRLLKMLDILPKNVGIAYLEGFRPLPKQKEYFDKKFQEILMTGADKETAYQETTKHVSPFIDNIPTHATGAAIDISLFSINDQREALMDMGQFDVTFGPNDQQETFSENTSEAQRRNRLLLLGAAVKAGLTNYGFEWWHYSYGDKMWAYIKKQKAAKYGLAVAKGDPILRMNKDAYLRSFD